MEKKEIELKLQSLDGWIWEENKLKKKFHFSCFREAMSFLLRLSYEAEYQNHHPEIFNCFDRVILSLSTHDGGNKVTNKDFDLAKAIDRLDKK